MTASPRPTTVSVYSGLCRPAQTRFDTYGRHQFLVGDFGVERVETFNFERVVPRCLLQPQAVGMIQSMQHEQSWRLSPNIALTECVVLFLLPVF